MFCVRMINKVAVRCSSQVCLSLCCITEHTFFDIIFFQGVLVQYHSRVQTSTTFFSDSSSARASNVKAGHGLAVWTSVCELSVARGHITMSHIALRYIS